MCIEWFQKITLSTHTHPWEGWKFQGGGGVLKNAYEQKLEIPEGMAGEEYEKFLKTKHFCRRLVSSNTCSHLILLTP